MYMSTLIHFIKELTKEIIYETVPGGELLQIGEEIVDSMVDKANEQVAKEQLLVARLLDYPYRAHTFDDWYFGNPHTKIDWDMQITTPRNIEAEIAMPYREYVVYLRRKYGQPSVKFFYLEGQKDMKIERLNEGLFLHHIAEEFRITLDDMTAPAFAKTKSPSIYTPENFIYCDFIEHLLLHIKIAQGDMSENSDNGMDIMGAKKIWRKINKQWSAQNVPLKYRKAIERIENRQMDYLKIMRLLADCIKSGSELANHCTLKDLAEDEMGLVHQELLDVLMA